MKEAIIKLLKVKTLVTLAVTLCLVVGFLTNKVSNDLFMPIVTLIYGFYFSKDNKKE